MKGMNDTMFALSWDLGSVVAEGVSEGCEVRSLNSSAQRSPEPSCLSA